MGNSKTWLLIANASGASLMRNKIALDLANSVVMPYISNSEYIDLWVNGEFRGNYLLTEKIQIGDNRIELENEDGILAELDQNYYSAEQNWFKSDISGGHFVLKDSVADDEGEEGSKSEAAFSEFEDKLLAFETLLYSDNKNYDEIKSYIDVDSVINSYFIQEFTENAEGCFGSVFMYTDGSDDLIHMGPVWDFDLALGNCTNISWGGNPERDFTKVIQYYRSDAVDWYTQLFEIEEFCERAIEINNENFSSKISQLSSLIEKNEGTLSQSAKMNFIKWDILGKSSLLGSIGH